jgi:hypothetical protein
MWYWIRTSLIVIAVTAMVWLFAEAESLRSERESVEVLLAADPKSGLVIDLVDRNGSEPLSSAATNVVTGDLTPIRLELDIDGATNAIEQFRRKLSPSTIRLSPGMTGIPTTLGAHAVNLLEVMQAYPGLKPVDSGVTITKVTPAIANVFIDSLVTRTFAVEVNHPEGETDGPLEIKPRSVTVTMPKAVSDRVAEGTAATANIDESTWRGLVPRQRTTLSALPLSVPSTAGASHVRITPASVDVSLTILAKAATLRLTSMPVHIRIPPVEYGKWDIDIPEQDRFLTDVVVTGPADLIEQLRQRQSPVVAFITLSFDDLERGVTSKDIQYSDVPTPLRFESASKAVRVKITRRERVGP